jgi:hypothetical protein
MLPGSQDVFIFEPMPKRGTEAAPAHAVIAGAEGGAAMRPVPIVLPTPPIRLREANKGGVNEQTQRLGATTLHLDLQLCRVET